MSEHGNIGTEDAPESVIRSVDIGSHLQPATVGRNKACDPLPDVIKALISCVGRRGRACVGFQGFRVVAERLGENRDRCPLCQFIEGAQARFESGEDRP